MSAEKVNKNNTAAGADNLLLIKGIGPVNDRKLREHGVTSFAQIAGWKKADIASVEKYLEFDGRIAREDWIGQARALGKSAKNKPAAKAVGKPAAVQLKPQNESCGQGKRKASGKSCGKVFCCGEFVSESQGCCQTCCRRQGSRRGQDCGESKAKVAAKPAAAPAAALKAKAAPKRVAAAKAPAAVRAMEKPAAAPVAKPVPPLP